MMDHITGSLSTMMALKEIAQRCGSNRRKRLATSEELPQGGTSRKDFGSRMSRLFAPDQLTMTTTKRGLLRIEIHPGRRWRWWGQRGWLVVLHLLHEQDSTWQCRRFFTNFEDLCNQLGIDEDDSIWQFKAQELPVGAGTRAHAEDGEWVPFCMF
jgi:hypothetical protein